MYPAFLDDPVTCHLCDITTVLCKFSMNLLNTSIGQYINQLVAPRKIFKYLLPLLATTFSATLPSRHGIEIDINNILFTKDL